MPWNDQDGAVPTCTEEQLLARARAKAEAMGQRRHRQIGAGVLSALLLVVGMVTALARDESRSETKLETVSGGPDTSTRFETSTSTADAAVTSTSSASDTLSAPIAGSATTSAIGSRSLPTAPVVSIFPSSTSTTLSTEPVAPGSTTTSTLVCRNSQNPACGPLVWDPPPGPNQPLTIKVTVTPEAPRAGDVVTFHVVVDDPDGGNLQGYGDTIDYGDGTPYLGVIGHLDCFPVKYGPWDSAARPVHEELSFAHVYEHAGTYTATFKFAAHGNCAYGPSQGTATPVLTVTKAP